MQTVQMYAGKGNYIFPTEQTAKITANSTASADDHQPESQTPPFTDHEVKLPLCVWESPGRLSEVELVYWALEAAKQNSLKRLLAEENEDDEDYRAADYDLSKLQEIQNSLFGLVTGLASSLSKAQKEVSHE